MFKIKNIYKEDLFLVSVFALPFILMLIFTPFFDANDVIDIQLKAARNLSEGKGYVRSLSTFPESFSYITSHPFGYSFIVAFLIKMGISMEIAAKLFKVTFYIVGLFAWYKFGLRWINKSYLVRITYLSLLSLHSIIISTSSTELFIWSLMPIISGLVLQLKYESLKSILLINFILCLFISFKFSGLGIYFILFCWLLFFNWKNIKRLVLYTFYIFLIPTAWILIILIFNYKQAGTISSLVSTKYLSINEIFNFSFNSLSNILIYSLVPEKAFRIIFTFIGFHLNSIINLFSLLILFFLIYYSTLLVKKEKYYKYIIWMACSFAGNIFILFIFSVIRNDHNQGYFPLDEKIYYGFIYPLLIIFIMICFCEYLIRRGDLKKLIFGSTISFSLILTILFIFYRANQARIIDTQKKIVINDIDSITKYEKQKTKYLLYVFGKETIYYPLFGNISNWKGKIKEDIGETIPLHYIFSEPIRQDFKVISDIDKEYLNKINTIDHKSFWLFILVENDQGINNNFTDIVQKFKFSKTENKIYTIFWREFTGAL